jgi:cell cycle arrest protein BUB2
MSPAAIAHSFNKILNQPKYSSKSKASTDIDEGIKKLRRLILVDGIPSAEVRELDVELFPLTNAKHRIPLCDHVYGSFFYALRTFQRRHFSGMLQEGHVRFGKRLGTTHSGMMACLAESPDHDRLLVRTLATDRGFKERVREDMLVRLLDAFVWRNYGEISSSPALNNYNFLLQTDKKINNWDSHMYKG